MTPLRSRMKRMAHTTDTPNTRRATPGQSKCERVAMPPNDPSSSFWSSPVGFENQSLSTQLTNKIRHLMHLRKRKLWLTSINALNHSHTLSLAKPLAVQATCAPVENPILTSSCTGSLLAAANNLPCMPLHHVVISMARQSVWKELPRFLLPLDQFHRILRLDSCKVPGDGLGR